MGLTLAYGENHAVHPCGGMFDLTLPEGVFVFHQGKKEKRAELRFDSAHRPEEFEAKLRPYVRS